MVDAVLVGGPHVALDSGRIVEVELQLLRIAGNVDARRDHRDEIARAVRCALPDVVGNDLVDLEPGDDEPVACAPRRLRAVRRGYIRRTA